MCVAGPVVPKGFTLSANGLFRIKCAAAEACPGGEAAYSESCSTGYGGLRCGACSDGHYWVGRKCKECYPSKFAVGLLAVVVPFIFALGVASKAPGVFGGSPTTFVRRALFSFPTLIRRVPSSVLCGVLLLAPDRCRWERKSAPSSP